MKFGYARCSTDSTRQDVDRQRRELVKLGVPKDNIYFEYESGTKNDRVELKRLLEAAGSEGNEIVATEVSRLSRSVKMLCEIIEFVKEKKTDIMK